MVATILGILLAVLLWGILYGPLKACAEKNKRLPFGLVLLLCVAVYLFPVAPVRERARMRSK